MNKGSVNDGSVDQEPFLINAYHRRDGESKVETDVASRDLGGGGIRNTLRRRYRRRGTSDADLEEGKHDSYSPRDKVAVEESKEDSGPTDRAHIKPPRHPAPNSSKPTVEDSKSKTVQERKTQPTPSLPIICHSNYIRKPDEKLREKLKNGIRSPADGIPEVHFLGEICEGIGFKDTFVSCKWYLEWGKSWSFLAGDESSQTQYAASDNDGVHLWNHPLNTHFATASMQGWPRIIMQLWELDEYGRSILSGYGFVHLPTNPGYHELEIRCWRPSGSIVDEIQSFFLNTNRLVDEKVIFGKAWEARSQLVTVSTGTVKMNVHVLLRFFNAS